MAVQIKVFEHLHQDYEPNHFDELELLMNNFLATIPENRVLSVVYDYHPIGNPKRPGVTRCVGYIIYKT